ncbi:membrane protein [Xenorhabdus stockiae]|uniref:Membrane protein n=1 Tax=Xenorhabdus stockiae TaxID=351614 RepID=A0A2D0KPH4_9GAMM|nr:MULTISPECIES: YqjD family protein [Xenorhabdus]PHM65288.1 membrane protein [Xenorhabdus stockiae]PHM70560.1 membrane protein [Xenorhabdus sp. KJ12.1]
MPQKKNSDELRAELQSLADTLEEVLNSSGEQSKAELEKIRNKAEKMLKDARTVISDAGDKLTDQTKEIAGRADNYVRDNPWTGVGIGAAVGIVLGVLLARR